MFGVLLLGSVLALFAKKEADRKKAEAKAQAGRHIGIDSYRWPHRDRFPTEQSFWDWFDAKGYTTQSLVFPYKDMVEHFQHDFLRVSTYLKARDFKFDPKLPYVAPDGLLGNATVNAMIAVDDQILPVVHKEWPALVYEARRTGQVPDPVSPPVPAPVEVPWGPYYENCVVVEVAADHTEKYHDEPHEGLTHYSELGLKNEILNKHPGDSAPLSLMAGSRALLGPVAVTDDHDHTITLTQAQKLALSRGESVTVASSLHESGPLAGSGHMHLVRLRCTA